MQCNCHGYAPIDADSTCALYMEQHLLSHTELSHIHPSSGNRPFYYSCSLTQNRCFLDHVLGDTLPVAQVALPLHHPPEEHPVKVADVVHQEHRAALEPPLVAEGAHLDAQEQFCRGERCGGGKGSALDAIPQVMQSCTRWNILTWDASQVTWASPDCSSTLPMDIT